MTFEDQLTRAFETLTERLRGDIDVQVQRTVADLVALATADRDRAASSTEEMEFVVAAARQEAHEEGVASRERLTGAIRSVERARSLTEILDALVSGARLEAGGADVWLIRGGHLHQWRSPGSDDGAERAPARSIDEDGVIADAARTHAVAAAGTSLAVPIAIAGQVVAVLHADLPSQNVDVRRHSLELLTRYVARCLEALTAFKVARALTERPVEPDAPNAAQPADEAGAEEDTSARRYARLLVSEIKLYHESAVVEGRRDRDLATRLGGDIARARAMYEQRVPPHVRQRADYFHDELVRTLANGDTGLLAVQRGHEN